MGFYENLIRNIKLSKNKGLSTHLGFKRLECYTDFLTVRINMCKMLHG